MAWIESHQEIGRHPKTGRFSRALGISRPTAIGHLHLLWHWSLDYAEDGDLTPFDDGEIAEAVMWEGDPAALLDALITAGFLDRDGDRVLIHDWEQYTGRLVVQREANRQRQQRFRDRRREGRDAPDTGETATSALSNGHVTVTPPSRNGATVHNTTAPNQTVPDRAKHNTNIPMGDTPTSPPGADTSHGVCVSSSRSTYPEDFEAFWKAYPSGHGSRAAAFREWKQLVFADDDRRAVMDGLKAWKACNQWQRGFIRRAESWLHDRQWEDKPPTAVRERGTVGRPHPNDADVDYLGDWADKELTL